MAGYRPQGTASRDAADPTVGDLLEQYQIDHGQMPAASLTPVLTRVAVVGDPAKPDAVYGESSDGLCRLVIGGVQVGKNPVYALMSTRDIGYKLSHLPLVGGGVDADSDISVQHTGTGVATGSLDASQVRTINSNILAAYGSLDPPPSSKSGPPLFPEDNLAESSGFAELGFTPPKLGSPPPFSEHGSGFDSCVFLPLSQKSKPVWVNVYEALGHIYVRRMGITLVDVGTEGDFELLLWVDGSLGTACTASADQKERNGLTIEIVGLSVGFTTVTAEYGWEQIRAYPPQGLGVDFRSGAMEIGGGLIYENNADYDPLVEGAVLVTVPQISILAEGAYAHAKESSGNPSFSSFFVFVRVQKPQGAQQMPPAPAAGLIPLIPGVITLSGFCLGFGFNSQLRVPGPAEVTRFPLLLGLTPQVQGKVPQGALGALEMLTEEPTKWVTPQDSAYWLAVGVQTVLVDFITCSALLVLSFKNGLSGALIGTLDMSVAKIAKFQAAVEAEASGELVAIGASLTDDSFFITEKAKIRGALDLYVFIGGDHRGEFVLTAGGYRVGFQPPKYWPQVRDNERIGLEWKISSWLSANAQFYWMVSSHGMMIGGDYSFDVSKDIPGGSIKGWLSLAFDVTVQWRPFFLLFSAGLSVGLRVKMLLVTVSVELGVALDGWLPPVGGRVEIKLPFSVRIGVGFGSQLESGLKQLTWDEFAEQKLPDAAHRIQITAESGLLAVPGTPPDPNGKTPVPWIVSTHGFVFSTRCVVPTTTFHINPPTNYPLPLNDPHHGEAPDPNRKLNVRPMGKPNGADLKSTHTVTIAHGKTGVLVALDDKDWKVNLVTEGLPQALWGTPLDNLDTTPPTSGTGLIDDQYTGIRVSIPDAQLGPSLPTIHATDLQLEDVEPDSDLPLNPTNTTPPNTPPTQNNQAINTITTTITTTQTTTARTNLDTALTNCQIAHTNTTPQTTNDYSPHTNDPLTHYTTRLNNGLYNTNPLLLTT
ncbi:DUF6603 domain-containing protein [Streptomyces sp. BA2]|uniref:DUF6603 domain-containing protein n=1 Tax=Streptomyces sp. BA2 TaxID=436595 RepID=UPI001325E673|nr:DUF6603 domain-containing protein [Streptomyces sp. BA2]MWA07808.1 hypothetical protein [Streptomyces sp. BA2]